MSSQVRFCKTTDSRSKLDSSSCCLFRLNFPFLYFHDAALITFRFRRSVRFRKTSWSCLKHFFWSPSSQMGTVWPSTKHACCVGRSLYKKNTQFVATKTAGNVSRRPQKDNHHRPPLSPAATGGWWAYQGEGVAPRRVHIWFADMLTANITSWRAGWAEEGEVHKNRSETKKARGK